jgi:hypothetical protein
MTVYGPLTLTDSQWGRERVVMDGRDVSWWRGFHTVVEERSHAEPFGWRSCVLFFPQATGHETLGVGDRTMLRRGVNVDVQRIKPDGTIDRANPLFEGIVTRVNPTKSETSYGIRVECVGYLYQADMAVRTPHELGLRRPNVPLGTVVAWALTNVRGRRYKGVRKAATPGVKTRKRGSMSQSPLNFAAELLAESWDANGDRWTVLDRAAGRRAHVVKKNTTTVHYTISYGGQGISIEAVDDLTERANVIFGSGIRPDGGAWSNYFFPEGHPDDPPPFPLGAGHYTPGGSDTGFTVFADEMRRSGFADFDSNDTYRNDDGDIDDVEDFQRRSGLSVTGDVNAATWNALFAHGSDVASLRHSYHLPLAWDPRVEPYLYNGQGARIGANPAYDPTVLRVEKWVDYGAGVTKRDARRSARREMHVTDDPAWVLQITMRTNPSECHRNAMKAGRNILIKHFGGGGGVLAHIADVTPRADGSVTLTADTQARDYMTLAQIVARNKENRSDPARGILRKASRGRTSFDQALQFDAESPAGRVAKHFVQGSRWRVRPVLFGGWGTIVKTEWHSDPDAQFWLGVFWKRPTVAQLTSLVGNPATTTDAKPWDTSYQALADLGLLQAYGTKDSPGGYWPHDKSDSTPPPALTGDYEDDQSWDWATDPDGRPVLWIAEFTDRDTTTWGRFYNAAQAL